MTLRVTKYNHLWRIATLVLLFCISLSALPDNKVTKHKVEKQETIFGIAKKYGVTIEDLLDANPFMKEQDFTLKKGMELTIPQPSPQKKAKKEKKQVNIGVLLPLHDINGDGKRMMEYYRGMLLAVEDLKKEGYNIRVNAWNAYEESEMKTFLTPEAASCDVIFGPLYTKHVREVADFCMTKNIRLVIPFSISGDDVKTCPQIFQVYQAPADITAQSIEQFLKFFSKAHTVFIDCNDVQSKKGAFTLGLRSALEENGMTFNITNLNNAIDVFAKAFAVNKPNVIVLNTGRSPELGKVLTKLDELTTLVPALKISMYGYNEWLMYTEVYGEKLRKYDTYIPSVYNYDEAAQPIRNFKQRYHTTFQGDMLYALPSFALTGYDHAMFFIKGIERYGKKFVGTTSQQIVMPLQTPLDFKRVKNGGYVNKAFMLIHYR